MVWIECYFLYVFQDKLRSYILACQDEETGGFADRPGDMVKISDTVIQHNKIQYIIFFSERERAR